MQFIMYSARYEWESGGACAAEERIWLLPKHQAGAMSSPEFLHLFLEDQTMFCHRMDMTHTPATHVRPINKDHSYFFFKFNLCLIYA